MKTTSFNGWIMQKLISYLTAKEGCVSEGTHYTYDGIQTIVSDSFGYMYQIEIKTVGRKHREPISDIDQKLFNIKTGGF